MMGAVRNVLPIILFNILFLIPVSKSISLFTAISSKEIFSNSVYNITIAVEQNTYISGPTIFTGIITSEDGNQISSQVIEIYPGESNVLSLTVTDNLINDYYNLTIKSENNNITFEDNTRIFVDRTNKFIFIQTDKPIYKPGETIHFRIIVLNRFFKTFQHDQPIEIKILDPERNIIKIWKNDKVIKGLMSNKLQLSTEPNLGEWKIEVKNENLIQTLQFSVGEYILPKFKVDVILPPFITTNNSDLKVVVQAKYTYGKNLKGECTLRLSRKDRYYIPRGQTKKIISKNFPIDGIVSVDFFDLRSEFGFDESTEAEFEIQSTVKDELTGHEQNGSNSVKIYQYPYKIEYINKPDSFLPGFPLKMKFKISTKDNIPIEDSNPNAFKIKHGFSYDEHEAILYSSIPSNGIVSFNFITPSNELLTISYVEVTYKKLIEKIYLPKRMQSNSNIYLQLSLKTEQPKINEDLELKLISTKEFNSFNYIIYGRGLILESKNIKLISPTKEYKFKVTVPPESGPEGKIIVFVMLEKTNEILADVIKFKVGTILQNKLNITLSEKILEPGHNLTIMMKTLPNSIIALRGVDQSVLLLKENKDINLETIENKLKESEKIRNNRNVQSRGSTAFQVFEKTGLTIITNGLLERHRWETNYNRRTFKKKITYSESDESDDYDYEERVGLSSNRRYKSKMRKTNVDKIQPRVRKHFPETWIWEEFLLNGTNNSININKIVPDTLTSWVITGYSLNLEYGIGVSLEPQILITFRPFFITLNLPYSVVKGEILSLQVLVHNYLSENITTNITLKNDNFEFEFMDNKTYNERFMIKTIDVGPSQVEFVTFIIVPIKFGTVMLNVNGITSIGNAGDALSQPLTVKPPGQQQNLNRAILIDLRSNETDKQEYNLTTVFPEKRVPGADNVKITVIADLLGTTISNLDKLLKMPCGCGEQNMLNFVPDIVILDYLTSTGLLTPEIKTKAIKFLESGYQRELTYRHDDGSFSAFGSSDSRGSTWLTAFVVRSFVAARPYITIDETIISKALEFLSEQQVENGSFVELGKVLHSDMQGGSSAGLALTAYTLLAFIEAKNISDPNYSHEIQKGLNYIAAASSDTNDMYAITLSAYTLELDGHSKKDALFNKLRDAATKTSDLIFWEHAKTESEISYLLETKPVTVEMTSYALLTYIHKNNIDEILPIGKWLLKQRNAEGGFLSTQDTVVGLTALAKFAKLTRGTTTDIQVEAGYTDGIKDIRVDESNAIVLQEFYLPMETRWVNFVASGKGTALAQLTWSYYVENDNSKPAFTIIVEAQSVGTILKINICTSYIVGGMSNMAVVEVNLPSGFTFDSNDLENLKDIPKLKRHDLDNGDTKLILYFDSINQSNNCVKLISQKVFNIEKQAPALVLVYDYYDTTKRATAFYEILTEVAKCEKDPCPLVENCTAVQNCIL